MSSVWLSASLLTATEKRTVTSTIGVAHPYVVEGADLVAPARLAWWGSLWNRPLGPVLAGIAPVELPEPADDIETWRASTAAALKLPSIGDALGEFMVADSFADAVDVCREHPLLVAPRWRVTVDAAGQALIQAQQDEIAAGTVRQRLGRLRQLQLVGMEHAGNLALTGEAARLADEVTHVGNDPDRRLPLLHRLTTLLRGAEPSPIAVAAQISLVAAAHTSPTRSPSETDELLVLAQEAVELADVVFGAQHQMTLAARLNLAV